MLHIASIADVKEYHRLAHNVNGHTRSTCKCISTRFDGTQINNKNVVQSC